MFDKIYCWPFSPLINESPLLCIFIRTSSLLRINIFFFSLLFANKYEWVESDKGYRVSEWVSFLYNVFERDMWLYINTWMLNSFIVKSGKLFTRKTSNLKQKEKKNKLKLRGSTRLKSLKFIFVFCVAFKCVSKYGCVCLCELYAVLYFIWKCICSAFQK